MVAHFISYISFRYLVQATNCRQHALNEVLGRRGPEPFFENEVFNELLSSRPVSYVYLLIFTEVIQWKMQYSEERVAQ